MVKETNKTFLLGATECELLTMSDEAIVNEVILHFEDLQDKAASGEVSEKTRKEMDKRLCHSGILFAEGKRLSTVYPELGRKLILASTFWAEQRGLDYFTPEERESLVDYIIAQSIQIAEDMKEQEKNKDEIIDAFSEAVQRINFFNPKEYQPLTDYLDNLRQADSQ